MDAMLHHVSSYCREARIRRRVDDFRVIYVRLLDEILHFVTPFHVTFVFQLRRLEKSFVSTNDILQLRLTHFRRLDVIQQFD